jgi:hypothetical protein
VKFKFSVKSFSVALAMGVVVLGSQDVQAQSKKSKASSYELASESLPSEGRPVNLAFGFKRYALISGAAAWTMHGLFEVSSNTHIGVGMGFDKDFDELLFVGDFRKGLLASGNTALFAEVNAGFLKAAGNHFLAGIDLGFQYALSPKVKMDFSYGLELVFGDAADHVGITQSGDFAGTFGVHWFF